jgi:hypothetical protein
MTSFVSKKFIAYLKYTEELKGKNENPAPAIYPIIGRSSADHIGLSLARRCGNPRRLKR